jgi:hypothetical protein
VFYSNCYLIVKLSSEDRLEELKRLKDFQVTIYDNINKNSEMWHITNDEVFKKFLNTTNNVYREKLVDIQKEFDKI